MSLNLSYFDAAAFKRIESARVGKRRRDLHCELKMYPAASHIYVSPDDYAFEDVTEEQLSMLRRGATLQMIALFSMSYTHDEGLKAVVDGNELYLGWNIVLHDVDHTGEEFMDWAVADVFERPERWE
ncbi:hypothetical protein NM688_g1445 [Phlebia brevispora]|uniref:Uncharacterized protein n=1 Tax=Phlebia brevispora TaxID=194682 RepID=A0ACC1TBN3_9APHY|nr:hypothetical protein NM688_g1445 [Phlebia brevispora]